MANLSATAPDTSSATSPTRRLRTIALIAAGVVSALAFADAITLGVTGENLVTEDDPATFTMVCTGLGHGLPYLALIWLLVAGRRVIDAGSRFRAGARWTLTGSYTLLLPFFLFGVLHAYFTSGTLGDLPMVYEVTAGVGFVGMFLGSLVLGLALWRTADMHAASRVLSLGLLAGFACTITFGFLAPDWSHPAYPETAVYLGTALLGIKALATDSANAP
jgi:hypothetical protein